MSTTPPIQIPSGYKPADAASTTVAAPAKTNGFLTFIKKLGSLFNTGVKKAIAIVQADAPAIEQVALTVGTLAGVGPEVQAVEGTFNLIFNEVVKVEQIATALGVSSGNGEQKLLAAIPQVEEVILSNPLFAGKTITDLAKWNAALAAITGAVYDLANSVTADPVPTATSTT